VSFDHLLALDDYRLRVCRFGIDHLESALSSRMSVISGLNQITDNPVRSFGLVLVTIQQPNY
ncbi:MAG: hypothetical protein ABJM18_12215, partial [Hyphomonas sp.]|uniref:hypothetical protein n=1 Tax=Hyphomonas sp. TaxID=87 RepID=UPI0032996AEE